VPQTPQKRERDELDEILDKYGATEDPRDREAVRKVYKEDIGKAASPTVFRKPGEEDSDTGAGGGIRAKTAEDMIKEFVSRGLDVAAGAVGGPTSAGVAALAPEVMRMLFSSQKPPEYTSPENAASLTSLLTNLATKASPLGRATGPAPLILKGMIEGAAPGAAYVAESEREGQPLTGASKAFALGFPTAMGGIGGQVGASTYKRATKGPAALSTQGPERVMSGELMEQVLPAVTEARTMLESLEKRSKIASGGFQRLKDLKSEAAANLPGTQQTQNAAAGSAQLAESSLATARQQRDLLRAQLVDTKRDLKLLPVEEKKLKSEYAGLEGSNPASMTERAKNSRRMQKIGERLGQIDEEKATLISRSAELEKRVMATTPQIEQLQTAARSARSTSKIALENWETIKNNDAAITSVVGDIDARTGWKYATLSAEDKTLIRKMASESPNAMIDTTIGAAMSGRVKAGEEPALNWVRSMNRVLNDDEKSAMRTIVAKRLVGEAYDQTSAKFGSFGVTKGSEGAFTPSGLSRIGETATNELFDSPNAYKNLMALSRNLHEANKPGLKLAWFGKGGTLLGGMAMFFWGARFAGQNPGLFGGAAAAGALIAGKIGWDKFVDAVVRKAHADPSKALFQSLENRMLMPAKGVTGSTLGQAVAEPMVRAKTRQEPVVQ